LYKSSINENLNCFLTREEQVMKFISLILQPGLITPSSSERNMQIANTAKLNSGCISRKVGAVITDENYYVKSTGWNDVAKGHTPCNLREVNDFIESKIDAEELNNNQHYSNFEKGEISKLSDYKYKNDIPGNFKDALIDYFEEDYINNVQHLDGKNCSFCFKTIHNHYEGEANQVHTRSLHAEENAMLQITKLGGQGVKNGILFTTASPCELCSKKAYQLGIKKIYFIDPYPGISNDQILKGGKFDDRPKMVPFSGAIGNAYQKFYEPFMSYKDEISLTLDLKPKNKLGIQFKNILKKMNTPEIEKFIKDRNGKITDEDVKQLIIEGLKNNKV
jgi:deoxycytidylate deaminase